MEESEILTINGKDEKTFLKTYNHVFNSVSEIGLDWPTLVGIHDYYLGIVKNKLEIAAQGLFLELKSIKGAHTVKYRIKDPEHVIDKIIRKKVEKGIVVSRDNFLDEFDDFIGFRILHLFKTDWEPIYVAIRKKYKSKEKPVAYHRKGDSQELIKKYKELGLKPVVKDAAYRSIHYIAKIPFFSGQFKCEIQIRTLFEEAWSEIDHLVRYPNNTDDELLNKYLLMFNTLAGCADDMGTFLIALKSNQAQMLNDRSDLELVVKELRSEVTKLKGKNAKQGARIDELMKELDDRVISLPTFERVSPFSTLDYITGIQNPSAITIGSQYLGYKDPLEGIFKPVSVDTDKYNVFPTPQVHKIIDDTSSLLKIKMPQMGIDNNDEDK